jgi:hypothetical protein
MRGRKYCELVASFPRRDAARNLARDLNSLGLFECSVWSNLDGTINNVQTTRYALRPALDAMDFLEWNPTPEQIEQYITDRTRTPRGK